MKFDEIILGWLLGLLGTPLVMYLNAVVDRRRFNDALVEELREVRFRLVSMVYVLRSHLDALDKSKLKWIISEIELYPSGTERDNILKLVKSLDALNDAELNSYILANKKPNHTKATTSISIPYLNSRLEMIGLLSSSKQRSLVNLLHYINIINTKSDEIRDWNRLTFEVENDANHSRACGNAEESMAAIVSSAERAIKCISNYCS